MLNEFHPFSHLVVVEENLAREVDVFAVPANEGDGTRERVCVCRWYAVIAFMGGSAKTHKEKPNRATKSACCTHHSLTRSFAGKNKANPPSLP